MSGRSWLDAVVGLGSEWKVATVEATWVPAPVRDEDMDCVAHQIRQRPVPAAHIGWPWNLLRFHLFKKQATSGTILVKVPIPPPPFVRYPPTRSGRTLRRIEKE